MVIQIDGIWLDYCIWGREREWGCKCSFTCARVWGSAISISIPSWIAKFKEDCQEDPYIKQLKDRLEKGNLDLSTYSYKDGLFWKKGHILLGPTSKLKKENFEELHAMPTSGHSGFHNTALGGLLLFIGQDGERVSKGEFANVMFTSAPKIKMSLYQDFLNPCLFWMRFGDIFPWTSLMASIFPIPNQSF